MMRPSDRLTLAVALAMLLGQFSLVPLTQDRLFLAQGAGVILLLQVLSLLLRRFGLPAIVVHLAQLVSMTAVGLGLGLLAQPAADRGITHLPALLSRAVMQIRVELAPMTSTAAVTWLMVLLIGLVTIVADILVVTLQATAWMLASLLTLYLIPALAIGRDVSWWVFALLGVGYLVVLVADGINENSAWTRNLASDSAHNPHSKAGALRLGALVGVPALILALGLGAIVPRMGNLDIESARPRGSGPLEMADPTIDLSKNLNLPVDRVVLTYKADEPLYLRTASLTVMDAKGWHMSPVQLKDGALPAPPGLTTPGKQVTAEISVQDLSGEYLPAPYAPQSHTAEGRWRYDPQTLTILSTEDENRTDSIRNKTYQVTSSLNDPQAENFTLAESGTPSDAKTTAAVPIDVPKPIMDIAHDVTKGASTPVLKAAAIQAYLSSPRNFGYSTTAPPGDGFEVLTNFLTKDKTGYCVHFASAMALMARIEGIPSRVSVGFLPGEKKGDHYEVKASNMHAWPELYFKDYGWVRFEPTSRVASAPEWSLVNKDVKPLPSATASGGASSKAPSKSPSSASASPSSSASSIDPAPAGEPTAWTKIIKWGAGILGLLGLLSLPSMIRLLSRSRRLDASADPYDRVTRGWLELRDTLHDLGQPWPQGTPRENAAVLSPHFDERGGEALDRLAMGVERSRYARTLGELGNVGDDVRELRNQLLAGATTGGRMLALLLPRSLWKRLTGTADGHVAVRQETDHQHYVS